jgi:AraC family transcriptional regulator
MLTAGFDVAEFAGTKIVSLRHFGPYETVDSTWADLSAFALEHGLTGPDVKSMGIVYDDPTITHPDRIRYDAALTIDPKKASAVESAVTEVAGVLLKGKTASGRSRVRPFKVLDVAPGPALKRVHKGPHAEITDVYTDAAHAIRSVADGAMPTPPYYEVYLNNPRFTPEEDLVTEVYIPHPKAKR